MKKSKPEESECSCAAGDIPGGGRGRGQACRVAGRCIFSTELDLVELSACGSALVFVSRSWLKMASLVTVLTSCMRCKICISQGADSRDRKCHQVVWQERGGMLPRVWLYFTTIINTNNSNNNNKILINLSTDCTTVLDCWTTWPSYHDDRL